MAGRVIFGKLTGQQVFKLTKSTGADLIKSIQSDPSKFGVPKETAQECSTALKDAIDTQCKSPVVLGSLNRLDS